MAYTIIHLFAPFGTPLNIVSDGIDSPFRKAK